jgi:hypothetical protein
MCKEWQPADDSSYDDWLEQLPHYQLLDVDWTGQVLNGLNQGALDMYDRRKGGSGRTRNRPVDSIGKTRSHILEIVDVRNSIETLSTGEKC